MRFAVWTWKPGARLPALVGRESTAREAEERAEKVFAAGAVERAAVIDGESGEILLSLPQVDS